MPKRVTPGTIYSERYIKLMQEMRGAAQQNGPTVSSKGPPFIIILDKRNIIEHGKITAQSIVETYFSGQTVLVVGLEDAESTERSEIVAALKEKILERISEKNLQGAFLGIEVIPIRAGTQQIKDALDKRRLVIATVSERTLRENKKFAAVLQGKLKRKKSTL